MWFEWVKEFLVSHHLGLNKFLHKFYFFKGVLYIYWNFISRENERSTYGKFTATFWLKIVAETSFTNGQQKVYIP
jgi:hypothetical protein